MNTETEKDTTSPGRMRRYVMMPAEGLESQSMTLEVLRASEAQTVDTLSRAITLAIDVLVKPRIGSLASSLLSASVSLVAEAVKQRAGAEPAFEVITSFGDEGPKLVQARPSAERLLRAAGYRLLPVTRYVPMDIDILSRGDAGGADTGVTDFLQGHLIPQLHAQTCPRGEGVVVGVIDTGVDAEHPQLAPAVSGGRGRRADDPMDFGPARQARGDHGTHVAGIVAARPLRGAPTGVAPSATLRSYRVFPHSGPMSADNADIIEAIRLAVDDGCHVVNLSLGGRSAKEDGVRDALAYAWSEGVLCIAAAGNNGRRSVSYPAAHQYCVGVSAVGREGTFPTGAAEPATPRARVDPRVFLADFTNVGPQVDATAPGVWIRSTVPGGSTDVKSGTSMAAPVVAGFAALLYARNRGALDALNGAARADALFKLVAAQSRRLDFGSYDCEGYGLPA